MKKDLSRGTIFLISMVILLTGCRTQKEQVREEVKTPVKLIEVQYAEMAQPVRTYGRLSSKMEVKLSFKVPGIIDRINVEEGQEVRKGQLLASLDLSEIESQVEQARSVLAKTQRDLERVGNLYKEKAATLEQYQNVQTASQVAASQLKAAEFNLKHAKIFAPEKGRILKRLMEENELIGAGIPLFLLAATGGDWIVRVGISDSDLVRIERGDKAEVTFDAYPERIFSASVSEIVDSADPFTGTFELELTVDDQGLRLASGFVAQVKIIPTSRKTYAVIPTGALVEADGDKGYVYSVDQNSLTAKKATVTIAFLFEDKVAVSEGLEGIEYVVSVGASFLTEGSRVELIDGPGEADPERKRGTNP